MPESIKNSTILTGNDLGILGNIEKIPSETEVMEFVKVLLNFDYSLIVPLFVKLLPVS